VWGKRHPPRSGVVATRFTPTRVGKTLNSGRSQVRTYGSPPRVWGKRWAQQRARRYVTVHPHACGENPAGARAGRAAARFTPTRVGKTSASRPGSQHVHGSPPRVWGKLCRRNSRISPRSVHPHACGENSAAPPPVMAFRRFTPTRVGKTLAADLTSEVRDGSPPRVWGKRCSALSSTSASGFTPTRVGKTR